MTTNRQQLINQVVFHTGQLIGKSDFPENDFLVHVDNLQKSIDDYRRTISQRTIMDLHDEDEDEEL